MMPGHFAPPFILIPGSSLGQELGLSDRGSGDGLLLGGHMHADDFALVQELGFVLSEESDGADEVAFDEAA